MYIKVRVVTGAKNEIVEQESDTLFNISVKEKAERNMANKRIIEVIGSFFGLERGDVRIVTGHRSPQKILSIDLLDSK